MEIPGTIPWEEVIRTWLDSEWYRLPGNIVDRGLVDNPDLADAEENSERLTALCLYLNRAPLLSPVPTVTVAELANIEPGDLPKLYIVPSNDWYRNINGTFLLSNASTYLRPEPLGYAPLSDRPHATQILLTRLLTTNLDEHG